MVIFNEFDYIHYCHHCCYILTTLVLIYNESGTDVYGIMVSSYSIYCYTTL